MKIQQIPNSETLLSQFAKGKDKVQQENGVMNCVIYTRVSSKEQMDTNHSLDWQKKHCEEYAKKNGIAIKGYFGGTFESAKSDGRKEFNIMLRYVKSSKDKIALILVYSLDRFSRTGDSAISIASDLKKIGINVLAVSAPIDTKSHAGDLHQGIQFLFNKFDNDQRRQKSVEGMREKLLRGEWIGHAPTGYSFVKGAETQTIIINEKGPLMKQAFEWRADGQSYEQILVKLKVLGLTLTKQNLTRFFRNLFYCGYISHNLLRGEVVKGNHPALITEDLFIRANNLKWNKFTVKKANDNLPLKVFVKEAESGAPFTGYIVQKKGLYYYKANKAGVRVNRSKEIMHRKFREVLADYTVKEHHLDPLSVQLGYTWENLTASTTSEKKSIANKLTEVEKGLYDLRRRHAIGKVTMDVYEEFSVEMKEQEKALLEALEKLNYNLSNPKELISFSCNIATKLTPVWNSGNYYQKRNLQNMLFPKGLTYDVKIEHYRTPEINEVFGCIADLSRDLEGKEKGTSQILFEKSPSVRIGGLEPTRLAAPDPKSGLATNYNISAS
jgi:site-specific DNA recombinase